MANRSKKTTKNAKKRLAIPASFIRNFEDARKQLKSVQIVGKQEVEKLLHKVQANDLLKKVQRHEMVKKATKTGLEVKSEVESRVKDLARDLTKLGKNFDAKNIDLTRVFPVASRADVQRLSKKVADLSKRLDRMGSEDSVPSVAN